MTRSIREDTAPARSSHRSPEHGSSSKRHRRSSLDNSEWRAIGARLAESQSASSRWGRMFQPRRMVSGSADKCDRHALARPPAAAAAAVATCAVFDAASAPLTRIHTPRGRHRQTSETLFPRERNGPLGRRLRRRPDRRRQFLQVCRLAAAARKKRKYKDEVLLQKRARENRWTRGERSSGSPREEIVYIATRASFQFSFFLVLIQRTQLRGRNFEKGN